MNYLVHKSVSNADKGGGVQNPENFVEVLYEWSLVNLARENALFHVLAAISFVCNVIMSVICSPMKFEKHFTSG